MENLNLQMLKAYDIYCKISYFTQELAYRLIKAIVTYYKKYLCVKAVSICRDVKLIASHLMEIFTEEFLFNIIYVYLKTLQILTSILLKNFSFPYVQAQEKQISIFRYQDGFLEFLSNENELRNLMKKGEKEMVENNAIIIDSSIDFSHNWEQVLQCISRSEEATACWDVCANSNELCEKYDSIILEMTDEYVNQGIAKYWGKI